VRCGSSTAQTASEEGRGGVGAPRREHPVEQGEAVLPARAVGEALGEAGQDARRPREQLTWIEAQLRPLVHGDLEHPVGGERRQEQGDPLEQAVVLADDR